MEVFKVVFCSRFSKVGGWWRCWKAWNEMEKRRKGGDLMTIYLKRGPQRCNGTSETPRTLTSPSVVA